MSDSNTQMELCLLDSYLNIMEREMIDFAEAWQSDTVPQRIDDLRVILKNMRGIVTNILVPSNLKGNI